MPIRDQDETVAGIEQFTAEIFSLENRMRAAGKEVPHRPKKVVMDSGRRDKWNRPIMTEDIIWNYDNLEAHALMLETLLRLAPVKNPTATASTVKPTAQVSAPKATPTTATTGTSTANASARRMTFTEKALAARRGEAIPVQPRYVGATAKALAGKQGHKSTAN